MASNKNTRSFILSLLTSAVAVVINYATTLVITPYISNAMGVEAYGFVYLAKQVSNYAILVTAALNAYASRFITIAYHEDDRRKANMYFNSVLFGNVGICCILTIVVVIFLINIERILVIPAELISDVRLLFLLDYGSYMLTTLTTAFTAYSFIKNKLEAANTIKCIGFIAEAIILYLLYQFYKPSVYYVGISLVTASFICLALNYLMTKRMTCELRVSPRSFSIHAVKELVLSGIWNSLNSFGNLLNSGLDLIVTNLMLSATCMGELSVVKTISTMFTTLVSTVTSPFHPILLKKFAQKENDELVKLFNINMKFTGFFSSLLFGGLVGFGYQYLHLWMPKQNTDILYAVMFITLIGLIVEGPAFPLFYVYTLTLKNKVPCIVTITSGFINVVSMYCLIRNTSLGLYAVVLTTSVLGILVYGVFTPIYTSKCLGVRKSTFFPAMLRVVVSGVMMALMITAFGRLVEITSWMKLILCAVIATLISLPVYYYISFNREEKKECKKYIKVIFKR